MSTFDVTNVKRIGFSAGGGLNAEIDSTGAGLQIKIATDDTIKFVEGTTLGMEFNRAGDLDLYMASHDIRQIFLLSFINAGSIADTVGNLDYNVSLADAHRFQVGSIEKMRVVSNEVFMSTGIDMNTFTIDNFTSLVQSGLPSISGSIRLRNDVAIGWHVASPSVSASGNFKYNTSDAFEMDSDLNMATSDIRQVGGVFFKTGGGDDAEIDSTGAGLQIKVATDDTIKFIEGTTLGMEFNRAGDLDLYMASHDIRQILLLSFINAGSIADTSGNLVHNVSLADEHQFQIGTIEKMTINSDTIQAAAVITMDENTLPATPVANDVVFYAKDDGGVSKLFYRSDDGTEVGPLGGGGLTAHNILSSTHGDTSPSIAPVTNDVLTWTGTEWLATDQISATGDDLGNHTATQDLKMAGFNVLNTGFYQSSAATPATVGVLRLGNDQQIAWRNSDDTGNMELKALSDVFDFTESSNKDVSIVLRAQDAAAPDANFTITKQILLGPTRTVTSLQEGQKLNLDIAANTIMSLEQSTLTVNTPTDTIMQINNNTVVDIQSNRVKMFQDLNMASNEVGQVNALLFENFGAGIGKNFGRFATGIHYDLEATGHTHTFRVGGSTPADQMTITSDTINVHGNDIILDSGGISKLFTVGAAVFMQVEGQTSWTYATSQAISNHSAENHKIADLTTPTTADEAANKGYADSLGGLGHAIEDEGTPLTQRTTLNVVGAGVTVTDSGGKTVMTIPGGGGGGVSFPITPTVDVLGTISTATFSIDLSLATAHHHTMTLATDTTIEFKNPPATDVSIQFELDVTQDATGGRTLSYENDLLTTAPAVKSGADDRTILIAQTQHPTTTVAYTIFDTALRPTNTFVPSVLTDLTDVTLTSVVNHDHLQADGSTWLNRRSLEFGATPAITGDIRISNNQAIEWRNQSGGSDLGIVLDNNDNFVFDSAIDVNGNDIILDVDADSKIDVQGDDVISMRVEGSLSWTYAKAAASASHNAHNHKIQNVTTPSAALDAVNKGYVDVTAAPDDLGNHTATQALKMAGFAIFNSSQYETSATSPSSTGVFRAGNNQVIGWRNNADDGNLELKASGADFFDFTDSSNGNVTIQLRAQDAVVADKIGSITQDSGATGPLTIQTGTETKLDIGANTVVDIDATRVKMFQDLNMATNEVGNVNALIFDVFGTIGKTISKFSTGLHYDIESPAHSHVFRIDGDPPSTQFEITTDAVKVGQGNIVKSSGAAEIGLAVTSFSGGTIGTQGTNQIPVDGGNLVNAAGADGDFGDKLGLYLGL